MEYTCNPFCEDTKGEEVMPLEESNQMLLSFKV